MCPETGEGVVTALQGINQNTVALYKVLLDIVKDESIYIEEYARGMIKAEEMHALEVKKMLKDFAEG